ncbi:MAG: right-handed parallel beta-helix repeat-containing protein [Clostridia bacterium]|nr:right-handed parallel beta-helix repeat-containing protein [Clostridia bacterium]
MQIYLDDYLYLSDGKNASPALTEAICALSDGDTLLLSEQRYDLFPSGASEDYYYISNNDASLKPIAFHLKNKKNITVDGGGASLMFHGHMVPFVLDNCENVTVKNLSVNYEIPHYAQGKIIESAENRLVLSYDGEEFFCKVKDGAFCFYSSEEGWENVIEAALSLEFDAEKKAPVSHRAPYFAYTGKPKDHGFLSAMFRDVTLRELTENTIEMTGKLGVTHQVGNYWVCTLRSREYPGIFITDSKDILLENVDLLHTASMGVICQLTENITLRHVRAIPPEGSKRMLSVSADATHFVNCRGKIEIDGCKFVSMMDDALNIHGIYNIFHKKINDIALLATYGHYQQKGINPYKPGDTVAVIDENTLKTLCTFTVKSSEKLSGDFLRIEADAPIPHIYEGCVLENLSTAPEVHIHHTESGNNRPRGFLLSTRGKTLVEHCTFYNMNHAIQIGGEMKDWYKSGAVSDITVRDNDFSNSAYAGGDVIFLSPRVNIPENAKDFHGKITIENNRFTMHEKRLLTAIGARELTFIHNTFHKDDTLPSHPAENDAGIVVKNCSDCNIEHPKDI